MLTTLFCLLIVLGLFHFIYECIALPHIHTEIRFKLFALRDRLRRLKYRYPDACDDQAFMLLQESLNTSILVTPVASLLLLYHVSKLLRQRPELKNKISDRRQELDACNNRLVKKIRDKQFALFLWSIFANVGGLALFILPLSLPIFLVAIYAVTRGRVRYTHVQDLVDMPEKDVKKVVQPLSVGELAAT